MRTLITTLIIFLFSVSMPAFSHGVYLSGQAQAADKTYKMIVTDGTPVTFWKSKLIDRYCKLVKDKSGGRITYEFYPAGQLFNDADAMNALGTGSVHMVWPAISRMATFDKSLGVVDLPFFLNDRDLSKMEFRSKLARLFSSRLERKGLIQLQILRASDLLFCSRKPLPDVKAFKGKKIRIVGGGTMTSMMEALGASAISIPGREMAPALAQGVIDVAFTTASAWSKHLVDITKYGTYVPGLTLMCYSPVVDKAWFDNLPAELQEILCSTMNEMSQSEWQKSIDADKKLLELGIKKDRKLTRLDSDSDISQWQKIMKPVYDKHGKKYEKIIKEYQALKK